MVSGSLLDLIKKNQLSFYNLRRYHHHHHRKFKTNVLCDDDDASISRECEEVKENCIINRVGLINLILL